MITFANKLGNLRPACLCNEPQLWWLGFLLYYRLLWSCFREGHLLNGKHSVYSKFSLCSSYLSCWQPEVT